MQTQITDYNPRKSASNLDRERLGSNIYESIHILSSLVCLNDQLITPKADRSNHPAAQLWKNYIPELVSYIYYQWEEWCSRKTKSGKPYAAYGVNYKNFEMICSSINVWPGDADSMPPWISQDVIDVHRSVLIRKNPDHYRPLWPESIEDLEMRYDWE